MDDHWCQILIQILWHEKYPSFTESCRLGSSVAGWFTKLASRVQIPLLMEWYSLWNFWGFLRFSHFPHYHSTNTLHYQIPLFHFISFIFIISSCHPVLKLWTWLSAGKYASHLLPYDPESWERCETLDLVGELADLVSGHVGTHLWSGLRAIRRKWSLMGSVTVVSWLGHMALSCCTFTTLVTVREHNTPRGSQCASGITTPSCWDPYP